jgi:hypothetical protein
MPLALAWLQWDGKPLGILAALPLAGLCLSEPPSRRSLPEVMDILQQVSLRGACAFL